MLFVSLLDSDKKKKKLEKSVSIRANDGRKMRFCLRLYLNMEKKNMIE